jgi:hypothetical protein
MAFTNVLVNGVIREAFVMYGIDNIYIQWGMWRVASWDAEQKMWSVTVD